MKLRTEYIIGKKTSKNWAGVYGYKPESAEKVDSLGVMYAVTRIDTGSKTFSSEKFAKLILDELQASYFEELDINSTMKRLEEACWKMKSRMDLILSREKELADSGIDMEMAICIFLKNYLYVVTIGESFVIIQRDGHIVNIAEALEDTNKSGFIKSGSLEILEEDRFMLATSKAFKSEEESSNILTDLNVDLLDTKEREGVSLMVIADEDLDWFEEEEPMATNVELYEDETLDETIEETDGVAIASASEMEEEMLAEEVSLAQEEIGEEEALENYDIDEDITQDQKNEQNLKSADEGQFSDRFLDGQGEDIAEKTTAIGGLMNKGMSMLDKGKSIAASKYTEVKNKRRGAADSEPVQVEDSESDVEHDESQDSKSPFGSIFHIVKGLVDKVFNHFRNNQTTYAYYIKNFLAKFKLLFVALRKWFKKNIIGKPEDRKFLNNRELKRNRWLFMIFILVGGIFLFTQVQAGINRSRENGRQAEAQRKIDEEFTPEYNAISTEVSANLNGNAADKQVILTRIDNLANTIELEKANTGLFPAKYDEILDNLIIQEDKLLLKERVDDDDVLIDISKSFQGVELSDFELLGDNLFITDKGQSAIYSYPKSGLGDLDIHISDSIEPFLIVANSLGEVIVYDKNSENSISKFDPKTIESLSRLPNTSLDSVGSLEEVAVFEGNDNLYEIRQNHQQIFKRARVGQEYAGGGAVFETANPPSWKVDAELANGVDIEAPFEVYVLATGLGVRRYFGGGPNQIDFQSFANFTLDDFENLKNGTALDVTNFGGTEGAGIMVVGVNGTEAKEGKLYVFDIFGETKQFRFKKQLVSGASSTLLKNIKEIQIDPVDNTLFVLDGNKVLRFYI